MLNKRKPSHPGLILKLHYMEPLKLTVTQVAKALGVSRKTLSQIINGRASVTADVALKLSKAFDTSPELWMNLQQNYTLWEAVQGSKDWQKIPVFKINMALA